MFILKKDQVNVKKYFEDPTLFCTAAISLDLVLDEQITALDCIGN